MAFNFMDLLGSVMQGTSSPVTTSRMNNAGSSVQDLLGSLMGGSSRQSSSGGMGDLLGSLMGAGQNVTRKVGGDNLAAAGLGALLGALTGKSQSTTANSLGGGLMGLLGMMAYKALTKKSSGNSQTQTQTQAQTYRQSTPQQTNSDAEIILLAMIDAAKSDGQVDADEFNKIISNVKSSGIGQDGVNYVLQKLQSPMETAKIVQACRGRPDLAAQVYSASLMAVDVDTQAEKKYLDTLAKALGLSNDITTELQDMTGSNPEDFIC